MAKILQHLRCTKNVRQDQLTSDPFVKMSVINKIIPLLYPLTAPQPPQHHNLVFFWAVYKEARSHKDIERFRSNQSKSISKFVWQDKVSTSV